MKKWAAKQTRSGFTIVELLIVVVVIAILAAITIVAYNGIQNRAKESALQSAVAQAGKKVAAYGVQNSDTFPADKAAFMTQANLSDTSDTTYSYMAGDTARGYCVSATSSNAALPQYAFSSTSGGAVKGLCVKNFAMNPSMEAAGTTGWGPRLSASLSRVTTESHSGSASMSVTTPGAIVDEGLNMAVNGGSVSSGLTGVHTGSAWVKAPAGVALRIMIEEYTSGGSYVAGTMNTFTGTGAWQRVSVTRTLVDATSRYVVNVRTNAAVAATYYVDDVMITAGPTLYVYGDGRTPGWNWSGATDASASFGPTNAQ